MDSRYWYTFRFFGVILDTTEQIDVHEFVLAPLIFYNFDHWEIVYNLWITLINIYSKVFLYIVSWTHG